jgi:hypothetical protein
MRAKTIVKEKHISEVQHFDRSMPTKAAIGVGGIILGKEVWDRKEKFVEDWTNFITEKFHHKTIYGTFGKWAMKGSVPNFEGWGKYKVYVEEIKISDGATKEGLPVEIRVVGKDKAVYNIPVDDKEIYVIENES